MFIDEIGIGYIDTSSLVMSATSMALDGSNRGTFSGASLAMSLSLFSPKLCILYCSLTVRNKAADAAAMDPYSRLRERDLFVILVQLVDNRLMDLAGVLKSIFYALSLLENDCL